MPDAISLPPNETHPDSNSLNSPDKQSAELLIWFDPEAGSDLCLPVKSVVADFRCLPFVISHRFIQADRLQLNNSINEIQATSLNFRGVILSISPND